MKNMQLRAMRGAGYLLIGIVMLTAGPPGNAQEPSGLVYLPKGSFSVRDIIRSVEKCTGLAVHYESGVLDTAVIVDGEPGAFLNGPDNIPDGKRTLGEIYKPR